MTYEEEMELSERVLDSLDLPKPHKFEDVWDYCHRVEEKFEGIELPSEFYGELFNFMDMYDIAEYTAKRFGMRVEEETKYYLV